MPFVRIGTLGADPARLDALGRRHRVADAPGM